MFLDTLQILLWSITYILIIIASFKNFAQRTISIPIVACILNFSWELVALINSEGFWAHIVWAGLDVLIIYFALRSFGKARDKIIFLLSLVLLIVILFVVFSYSKGMLISVFVIDIIMAFVYVVDFKKMTPTLKIPIAIAKLFGDLFAGIYYGMDRPLIAAIAIGVLVLNFIYLLLSVKEWCNLVEN